MLANHPFELSSNPRSHRSCVRCGRIPEVHPEPPPEPEGTRDRAFEFEFTEAACAGVIDPAALNEFADRRADPGPVRDFATRDLERDALEEFADARNYLVWRVRQLDQEFAAGLVDGESAGQARERLTQALQYTALAFWCTSQARALRR